MFEGIPFVELPIERYSSQGQLSEKLAKKSSLFPTLSAMDIQAMTEPAYQGSFHLSGRIRLMAPLPITTTAREQLLYLESFSLAQSDDAYFTQRSSSETFLLCYTYGGSGLISYEGKQYVLQEGDGFWIDCRRKHRYETESTYWEHGDLHFNGYAAHTFFSIFTQSGSIIFHSKDGFQRRLEHLLQSYQRIQPRRELMIHAGLTELLSWLLEKQNGDSPSAIEETVHMLIQYMQAHFSEPICMDKLSLLCGISKYHLSREFKRLTGYAPIEYLLTVRMENAGTLLRSTDLPISIIAERCGIGNEQYFSRLFQKHYGTAPGKYRKQGIGVL